MTMQEDTCGPTAPEDELSWQEKSPSIDYLQRAIALLLMKNETMRFELFTVRQRIERIERAVFGADAQNLRKRIPPQLLGVLRDLCCGDSGGERGAAR